MKNLAVLSFLLIGQIVHAQSYGNNKDAGGYASINGIQMYYEVYGKGEPLVLLHGNGGTIAGQRYRIDYFSKYYRVIAIDSRAHGKSIDTTSVLTYEMMAKDINDLLDVLQVDSAYIWGQSDGAILALLLSIHYPDKVKKAAGFAANLRPDTTAVQPEIQTWAKEVYKNVKGKQKQLFSLLINHPNIPDSDLQKIRAPFMVMTGDRDAIRLTHSIEIFNNIPTGFLFVMPASTHFGAYEHREWFNLILHDFFRKDFHPMSSLDAFLQN